MVLNGKKRIKFDESVVVPSSIKALNNLPNGIRSAT